VSRLARKNTERPVYKEEKPIKKCTVCEKQTVSIEKNFYSTTLTDYFPDGRIPMCKECCKDRWVNFGLPAFIETLQMMDKPLYEDRFKLMGYDYQIYIRNITSIWKDSGTFVDSTMFIETQDYIANKQQNIEVEEMQESELKAIQKQFGIIKDATEENYMYLRDEYADYCVKYEVEGNKSLEKLIVQICVKELQIRMAQARGEETDKLQKTLQDLLGSANLKPVQETGNQAVEAETLGTLVERWEKTKPIPDPLEEWIQSDSLGKTVRVWFTGHLLRMMGLPLPSKLSKEYYDEVAKFTVEQGDEVDDEIEEYDEYEEDLDGKH